jgi:ribose/xylose/arabinose/galactoside ABC-type transport system permease subunit
LRKFIPVVVVVAIIWAFFEIRTGGAFLSLRNLAEMAQEYSYEPLLALGVVFVLLVGEIDLSIGYLTLLAATILALLVQTQHWPAAAAIPLTLGACSVLGLAQGGLIAYLHIPSFVVTLAGFLIFEGIAFHVLSGATINVFDPAIAWIGTAALPPGIPFSLCLLLVATLIAWFVATRTRFGRYVYAVGGNAEAARRAGIPVLRIRALVFAISGLAAGIAGIMLVGYSQAASTTTAGPDLLLDAITIAVIGGVSLSGGRGSVWGVLAGGLIIASLDSGLNLMSVDPTFVYIIKGAILLLAIGVDVTLKRRSALATHS